MATIARIDRLALKNESANPKMHGTNRSKRSQPFSKTKASARLLVAALFTTCGLSHPRSLIFALFRLRSREISDQALRTRTVPESLGTRLQDSYESYKLGELSVTQL